MAVQGRGINWELVARENRFDSERAMLEDWYRQGMSQEDIGLRLDLSTKTIGQRIRHYGLRPEPGRKSAPRRRR